MKTFKTKTTKFKLNYFIFSLFLIVLFIFLYRFNYINDKFWDFFLFDNYNIKEDYFIKYAFKEVEEPEQVEETKELIKEVYIYNTHQEETYKSNYLDDYNIKSTVLLGSKILKEYLEDEGIGVYVEERNIPDEVRRLNKKYGYSYTVSREFMEDAYKKVPTLKFFIDFHRDSSSYEKTTIEIDGEKYAKVLFVVGLDNKSYEPNLLLAENLSNKIKEYNENLFRGIMKKSGAKVNGIYNQDFNVNTILIEVGGQYNSIEEVNNTLKVLAPILASYIKENI